MDNFRGFIPTKYMSTKYSLISECAHADVANMTIQIDLCAHFYPRFLEKQLFFPIIAVRYLNSRWRQFRL